MSQDNVVDFPKNTESENFPLSLDDAYDHVDAVRREYCDEITTDAVEAIFAVLSSYGINVKTDEDTIKNIVFMEEAVKSLIYSTKNLDHSFQEMATAVITITPEAKKELSIMMEEKQLNT